MRRKSAGFSMIEVLVVIVLFSFALIGLVGLQARAVQTSVAGEDANRAALLANDIASAMWAANTVNLAPGQITDWNAVVADSAVRGLPNGVGTITVAGAIATITVTWRAPHEPAGTVHNYTTQVTM
ncbi:MAG: prepilin-type N-terminal cleavage/methylation domain-containing protein [Rubrivivax sp.]